MCEREFVSNWIESLVTYFSTPPPNPTVNEIGVLNAIHTLLGSKVVGKVLKSMYLFQSYKTLIFEYLFR